MNSFWDLFKGDENSFLASCICNNVTPGVQILPLVSFDYIFTIAKAWHWNNTAMQKKNPYELSTHYFPPNTAPD